MSRGLGDVYKRQAIQAEFGIPVKYIGVGEKVEDLQKFDSDTFVNALFDVDNGSDED